MAGTMGNGARNVKGIPQTRGACSRFAVNGNPPVKDGAMATFFWRVWPRRYSGAAPTDVYQRPPVGGAYRGGVRLTVC
jgi:hypothetical protein